jgi:hypothetical protein
MENLFYLRSRHGDCGDNVMFWNKDGRGYGTDLDKLHLFTKEEAQEKINWDITSLPLLKSEVDKLSITAVDHQYLDKSLNVIDKKDQYMVQITGDYNGNDIRFVSESDLTFNYSLAKIFNLEEALTCSELRGAIWSKSYLDGLQRRTFQSGNISTRKMITGPGIKYKKPRPSKATGKIRWNCPSCGRISWQFNPYDYDGCKNTNCKEWDVFL